MYSCLCVLWQAHLSHFWLTLNMRAHSNNILHMKLIRNCFWAEPCYSICKTLVHSDANFLLPAFETSCLVFFLRGGLFLLYDHGWINLYLCAAVKMNMKMTGFSFSNQSSQDTKISCLLNFFLHYNLNFTKNKISVQGRNPL